MRTKPLMKSFYTTGLLLAALLFAFPHAYGQKPKPKAKAVKTVKKPIPATVSKQKAEAKKIGDVAAKVAVKDTVKKGGQANTADTRNTGSLSEEIIVTTSYKPVLADAVKIRRNPDLEDHTPFKAPLTYTAINKRLEQNSDIKQLDPQKLPADKDSVLNNNFVKVGFGSLKTTFAEAYVANGKDNALQVGAWIKHFGQQGTDVFKQNENRQDAGVFGKSIGADNTLSGRVTFNRHGVYYYGFASANPASSMSQTPASQHYNNIGAEGELAKNYIDTDKVFDYSIKAKGYLFSNANQARENNIVITGFINQTVKQFYAGLTGTLDLASQKDAAYNLNNSLLRANPYLKFQGDSYKIDAGVNIVTEFGLNSRVNVFPAARAELQVVPAYARIFIEAKGDVNKASLKNFADNNPFIGQNLDIKNTINQLDLTAGVKGTLARGLGFKLAIFRNEVKDMALFVSNFATNGNNQFLVVYDTGKAIVSGLSADLDYKVSSTFNLFARGWYKNYKMDNQLEAWNMPKFNLNAGTIIHINDKLDINATMLIRSETKDLPYNIAIQSLPAQQAATPYIIKSFADVSAGASYKITNKFSAFAQANNLLNTNYSQWQFYRNYGFNIFGGVGYSF